jgi:hypothetical protein
LAAAEAGRIRVKISAAILEEVADVLQRERFGWTAEEANAATEWLTETFLKRTSTVFDGLTRTRRSSELWSALAYAEKKERDSPVMAGDLLMLSSMRPHIWRSMRRRI